jgi:hypothetical protein
VTTYEYEGDRLVRSVTVREPEYDQGQLALLLASRRRAAELNEFGIPISEAMDPANQFVYEGQQSPNMDWSVKAARDESDRYYEQHPKVSRNGHRWGAPKRRDSQSG